MGHEARLRKAAVLAATDPEIKPLAESRTWYETGPYAITGNSDLATLIVRIGMASNALVAQMTAAVQMMERENAPYKMRDALFSLVTTAAFTNEAIQLARSNMSDLRDCARRAGAKNELLARIGKLCGNKHPASEFLARARNQLGFHWDGDRIQLSVSEFGKNKKVVWLESDAEDRPFHRLACEVLGHALFPEVAQLSDQEQSRRELKAALGNMGNAIDLIVEFFTAAVYGFLKQSRAVRGQKK